MIVLDTNNGKIEMRYDLSDDAIEVTAVANGSGVTAYMSAEQAMKLASALLRLSDYAKEAQEVKRRHESLIEKLKDWGKDLSNDEQAAADQQQARDWNEDDNGIFDEVFKDTQKSKVQPAAVLDRMLKEVKDDES